MKKVLVTGAEGLVGSAICRRLVREGKDVVALYRTAYALSVLDGLDIDRVQGDITDQQQMDELIDGMDAVVHAAADIRVQGVSLQELNQTNVQGTKSVAQACQRNGVDRLIFISSASIFMHGPKGKEGTEKESSELASFELSYAKSKRLATEWLRSEHKRSGLPAIILAPTFVIGPYDRKPGSGQLLLTLYHGKLRGYSNGGKNFVHVDSVADAVAQAMGKGRLGEAYIIGGENLSYRQFFEYCLEAWERPFNLRKLPNTMVRLAGSLGSSYAALTGRKSRIDRAVAYYATIHQYYDHSKAQEELGYDNKPIREAIAASTEWFRNNGYL